MLNATSQFTFGSCALLGCFEWSFSNPWSQQHLVVTTERSNVSDGFRGPGVEGMIDLFRLQKTLAGYHSVAVERWLARSQLHQTQHGGRYVKSWRLPDSDGQNLSKSPLEWFQIWGKVAQHFLFQFHFLQWWRMARLRRIWPWPFWTWQSWVRRSVSRPTDGLVNFQDEPNFGSFLGAPNLTHSIPELCGLVDDLVECCWSLNGIRLQVDFLELRDARLQVPRPT